MIEVQDLTKKYGQVVAVNGVSFVANPGSVTGFLGPNGAGKTTTMRMLTGFMPPTAGKALVAGYDVFEQSMEVRKRVGYLPENVPVYRDMTALGYLSYIAEIRGISNRRDCAADALKRVALYDRADSRIRTLSKGMRQRVGLAQALLHDPEVLILDEPTIGLDPIQVLELRDLVRDLGRNHTVLFSTHILSEAEQVCDSVVIINRGVIVAQGSPVELRKTLERGGRVFARFSVGPEVAMPVIAELASVTHVEPAIDGVVAVPVNADTDPRPEIARAALQNGWDLIELRPLAVNLEDIFLELTRRAETPADSETAAEQPSADQTEDMETAAPAAASASGESEASQ